MIIAYPSARVATERCLRFFFVGAWRGWLRRDLIRESLTNGEAEENQAAATGRLVMLQSAQSEDRAAYFFAPAWYFIRRFSPTVWIFLSATSSPRG